MVDLKRKGSQRSKLVGGEAQGGTVLRWYATETAGVKHTQKGVFSINGTGKDEDLRKQFYAWMQTASNDHGLQASVLPLPITEMCTYVENSDIVSAAVLHACKHAHNTHTHTLIHSLTHISFASAQQRSHNIKQHSPNGPT